MHLLCAMHGRMTFDAVLDVAFRLAYERLERHAAMSEIAEPHSENGRVIRIPETAGAVECLREAGFSTGSCRPP